MFEKLQNLIIHLFIFIIYVLYFAYLFACLVINFIFGVLLVQFWLVIINIPFIAYAFARILINFIFQSINVLLLGINYGTYSLESYLAKQLKNNTRTAYQTLGKHTTAYGFIFIKNIPFYALKALHATLIIAFLLPLHIMVQSFAFLARKINLPTATNLMSFVIAQTNDNKFFTGNFGIWIFNKLAKFDFWVSKNFYITKNKLVIPSQKESNIVNKSTDWIRKSLYELNRITSVFKDIVSVSASIVGTIVILALDIVDFVQRKIIKDILGIQDVQIFFSDLLKILLRSVGLSIGKVLDAKYQYIYDKSLLYASFIALEYFVIRAIDTITEIVSIPFRFLSQALYTLYELFTDQDFDYRKFDDSLHSYQLDQKKQIQLINNNLYVADDTFTKINIDTNDEAYLMDACENN